jgi:hypothetical protein
MSNSEKASLRTLAYLIGIDRQMVAVSSFSTTYRSPRAYRIANALFEGTDLEIPNEQAILLDLRKYL